MGLKIEAKSLRSLDKKRRGDLSYKSWIPDEIRGDGELIFLSHRCAADHNIGGRNALQEGRDSAKLGVLIRNL